MKAGASFSLWVIHVTGPQGISRRDRRNAPTSRRARGGRALLRGRQLSSRDCGVPKRGEPVRLAANQRAPSRNCTTADAHG